MKKEIILTPRMIVWLYLVPMACFVVSLILVYLQLEDKNAAQDQAARVEQRQNTLEEKQAERLRKERALLVAASDRRICARSNADRDILGDILREFLAQSDTPEERERFEGFFGDALRRLAPEDCSKLPTAKP